MLTMHLVEDTPKALREVLARAQTALGIAYAALPKAANDQVEVSRFAAHLADLSTLDRLIAEIDILRPLGPDGKHGDRHTTRCGCPDRPAVSESTGHVWPCTRYYVTATNADPCTCWKGRADA